MGVIFDPILGQLRTADAAGGGSGTVASVSVVTANGVSGTVANPTTTPAITLALGAVTPTSVNSVVLSGAATPTLAVTGTTTVSGSNTGDQTITLTGAVTGSGTGSFATTIATPGTLTVSSTNSTATAHTHAITSSSAPGIAASLLATDASGIIGSTGARIVKGWFTDLTVTNAIAGSVTGNAATVTTNANLTGVITSVGNATSIASQTGTGSKFVVDTTPTLVTPVLGVATATSINKVAITAPATSATLTIANSKTLTVNNSITFAGTDATTMTFPSGSDTVAGLAAVQTITGAWSYNDGKLILNGATSGATTLKSGAIAGSSVITLPIATDTLVGKATTDTLTNKTLTAPVISSIVNTGTLTLPTSTDTLVGRATTDTLTNKTIAGSTNSVSANTFTNPYKFRVYRGAAQSAINGSTVILFDTKTYDTSSNVDIVTNKGRFTAPVAGFYNFTGVAQIVSTANMFVALYKNGSQVSQGVNNGGSSVNQGSIVNDTLQLAASDYVEVYVNASAANALFVGPVTVYFTGFLISTT